MDLKEYHKNVQLELKADNIHKNFLEEKKDIVNAKRGYIEELEDKYKPIIDAQKDLNKNQNITIEALVKQIMNNQQTIKPEEGEFDENNRIGAEGPPAEDIVSINEKNRFCCYKKT